MNPDDNNHKPPLPPYAHPAGEEVRPEVSNVRTNGRKARKDACIEVRVDLCLKTEAQAKAKAEGKTLTSIINRALLDYTAGSYRVRRQRYGHGARKMQAAELRQGQVIIGNHLADLLWLAQQGPEGPMKSAACQALLEQCANLNRQQLSLLLRDHVC